jgi:hypothetical protein
MVCPIAQVATVQLAAWTQTYLQVQWAAGWQFGFPEAGWGFAPNTFVITSISPQLGTGIFPDFGLSRIAPRHQRQRIVQFVKIPGSSRALSGVPW